MDGVRTASRGYSGTLYDIHRQLQERRASIERRLEELQAEQLPQTLSASAMQWRTDLAHQHARQAEYAALQALVACRKAYLRAAQAHDCAAEAHERSAAAGRGDMAAHRKMIDFHRAAADADRRRAEQIPHDSAEGDQQGR